MIRILLADDHPLTRSGLAAWLEKEEGVELAALASDGSPPGSPSLSFGRTWPCWTSKCRAPAASTSPPEYGKTA
jgi:CheY-like chemotaxis protein